MGIYSLIIREWFTALMTLTMAGFFFVQGILKPKNKYWSYGLYAIILLGFIYKLFIAIYISKTGRLPF
jgi:membrane protein YdbS with pleckstrin-like domain